MGPVSVLITGASRGLGLEFIKQILCPPQFLIATCHDPTHAKELQALANVHGNLKILKMDVTKDDEIESVAEQAQFLLEDKGLTLLINNAGSIKKVTQALWRHKLEKDWLRILTPMLQEWFLQKYAQMLID